MTVRALLLTLTVAAGTTAAVATDNLPSVPRADHHQHLQSAATAELANRTAPPIDLPMEVTSLLRQREQRWNDSTSLQALFTSRGQVFAGGNIGWVQGSREAAEYLSRRFARPYRLTPTASHFNGTNAWVTGYYTRGETPAILRIGYFHLSIERGAGGDWLISSEVPVFPGPAVAQVEDAGKLVEYLDQAGIRLAVVLSNAYYFDSPKNDVPNRLERVRAENDWTAQQVAGFKERLVAFCSFNPLADYALDELERCAASKRFVGIKLHFGMSAVNLLDPAHVEKVRAVVEAANKRGMALIVHVRAGPNYGREDARVLLDRVVSAAPDVTFQIAHLWGGEQYSADALEVYANACARGEKSTQRLYFDLAEVALVLEGKKAEMQAVVARMREIGMDRILYGSDGPVQESQSPADGWKLTQTLPLTPDELARIANNVAPYLH